MVHIGIIPDGNRRWCKNNNYELKDLTKKWIEFIIKILYQWTNLNNLKEINEINEISIYISSIDNINRNDNTKNIIEKTLKELINIINNEEVKYENKYYNDIRKFMKKILENYEINVIGDIDILSENIKKELMKYKNNKNNKNNKKKYVLNIAYAYDYYKDILNEKNKDNENYNRKQSNIDLIIRSGGEKRLSGFFPTKTIYSELFFIDKLWLDINIYDIIDILIDYKKRNRRFGK